MSTSSPEPKIVIDNTYGAAFIGALVSVMLYGCTTLQTYIYFICYPKDSNRKKSLVSFIWVLDTIQTIFVSRGMYYYLITNFANPSALEVGHWSLSACVVVNITIACFVQGFFTVRIFRLSRPKIRWWLCSFIGLSVIGHFCFGIGAVVLLFIKKELKRVSRATLIAVVPFTIFAVLSDVAIGVTLCFVLHGSRTGFQRTNTLLNTLIIYAINRCLLTSSAAVAEVIVFALSPRSLWFQGLEFNIGKLYANSLLATLNSRKALRCDTDYGINNISLSAIGFREEAERGDAVRRSVVISLTQGERRCVDTNSDGNTDCSKPQNTLLTPV